MSSRRFAFVVAANVLVLAAALAATARACPPSLTVSQPAGGSAEAAEGTLLIVHAVQGCHPGALTVTGTADGLVRGAHRSVPLVLEPGPTPNAYRVRRQWPEQGVWVLRLTVHQGRSHATALVGIDAKGAVTTVRLPTPDASFHEVSDADVAAMLRSLAAG